MSFIIKHKFAFLFSFLFVSALCLGGCSGSSDDDLAPNQTLVKVAFWGSPEEIEIITDCINDWEETHPDIKVRFEHTPYGGYVNKILTRIAGNAAPDVICTEVNYFVTFATAGDGGVLENLSPYIEADNSFTIDDFFPEVVGRFTRENKVLAVPRDTAPFACMFYNKDLFDEAGVEYPTDDWTYSEFLEKAKALTKRDEKGKVLRYGFYGWAWQNFVVGNGGSIVDDVKNPTRCTLDDPKSVEGMQFFTDLINKYKVMPTPVALSNMGMGVDYMFAQGRLAMFLSGMWETPALRNYDFNWDVAMFPKSDQGIRRFGTGGSGYAMLKTSNNKEQAWEVIKALTGIQSQIKFAKSGLGQPARIEIAKNEFANDPAPPTNKAMVNEAVKYAVYDPFHPTWREYESRYLTPALDLIKNGKKTVQEAFTEVSQKINKAMAEED